jgi:hypothetical protein
MEKFEDRIYNDAEEEYNWRYEGRRGKDMRGK